MGTLSTSRAKAPSIVKHRTYWSELYGLPRNFRKGCRSVNFYTDQTAFITVQTTVSQQYHTKYEISFEEGTALKHCANLAVSKLSSRNNNYDANDKYTSATTTTFICTVTFTN